MKNETELSHLSVLGGAVVFFIVFHRLTIGSFCSLIKGITPKIRMFCLVLINSVLLNLFMCLDLVSER